MDSRKWLLLWHELVESDFRLRELLGPIDARSANPEERALVEWIAAMDHLTRTPQRVDERLNLLIRHEELIADPRRSTGLALSAADLPHSRRVLDFAVRTTASVQHVDHRFGWLQGEVDRLLALLGYES